MVLPLLLALGGVLAQLQDLGRLCDLLLVLVILKAAGVGVTATAVILNSQQILKLEDLLLDLSLDINSKILNLLRFFLALLLHKGLLHLHLLLLPHLHHHLLYPVVHLLLVVVLIDALPVDPRVLHYLMKANAFFWVGVQHLLHQVCSYERGTFEFGAWVYFTVEDVPEFFLVQAGDLAVVLVFHVCELEGFGLHDQLEEEAPGCENVDLVPLIGALADLTDQLRRIALERADSIGVVVGDGLAILIDEVPGIAKIDNFKIELGIKQYIF